MGAELLNVALLLNPTDAYRLLNMGSGAAGSVSGMIGIAQSASLAPAMLIAALMVWVIVPLTTATLVFSRREL
jgi:Cu-processing system permease protein